MKSYNFTAGGEQISDHSDLLEQKTQTFILSFNHFVSNNHSCLDESLISSFINCFIL